MSTRTGFSVLLAIICLIASIHGFIEGDWGIGCWALIACALSLRAEAA